MPTYQATLALPDEARAAIADAITKRAKLREAEKDLSVAVEETKASLQRSIEQFAGVASELVDMNRFSDYFDFDPAFEELDEAVAFMQKYGFFNGEIYNFGEDNVCGEAVLESEDFPRLAHCRNLTLDEFNPNTNVITLTGLLKWDDDDEHEPELFFQVYATYPADDAQEVTVDVRSAWE